MKKIPCFLVILMIFSLSGCRKEVKEEFPDIKLPVTSELVTTFAYGAPVGTYLRIRENPDINSAPVDMIWKNDIFEIITKTADPEVVDGRENYWYKVKFGDIQGWVFGSGIRLYEDIKNIK